MAITVEDRGDEPRTRKRRSSTAGLVAVSAGVAQRVGAAVARRIEALADAVAPERLGEGGVALRVSAGRIAWASPAARTLFGARRGDRLDQLTARLASVSHEASGAIDGLCADGAAFSCYLRLNGAIWLLRGRPVGPDAMLEAFEASDIAGTLEGQRIALQEARRESDALRKAVDQARARASAAEAEAAGAEARGAHAPRAVADPIAATFRQLRIGIGVFDAGRKLSAANDSFFQMFGVSRSDFGDMPTLREMVDLLRERRMAPEDGDFAAWRDQLFGLFGGRDAAAIYDERWELPDHRVLHVIGQPCADGVAFTVDDVTATVEMERWRTTALKSRAITLDALLDGVVEFSPDGSVRGCNGAFLRLWRLEDGEQEPPRHIAALADACAPLAPDGRLWDALRGVVSGHAQEPIQQQRVRLSDRRVLEARVARMPDGKTIAAFTDVTDSERVADALRDRAAFLEAADAMRASALYEISHGLRTPISAVIGFADLLANNADARSAGFATNILESANALREGVERLSELVAAGSPSVDEVNSAVSVTPMLHSAAALLERRLRERGARFDFADAPTEVIAKGDPARVRQLIFAMLSEAAHRVAEGGVLRVSADALDGELALYCASPQIRLGEGPSSGFAMAQRTALMHGAALSLERGPDGEGRVVYRTAGLAS
jgi:signal transduction histidine kinase